MDFRCQIFKLSIASQPGCQVNNTSGISSVKLEGLETRLSSVGTGCYRENKYPSKHGFSHSQNVCISLNKFKILPKQGSAITN
jgi:hypothetical protein